MLQYHSLAPADAGAENSGLSRVSGHSRVTVYLRTRIHSGEWAPGTAIPSRRQLAAEYNVSPATIERAIVPLLTDGTLRADDRRGTFVAKARPSVPDVLPASSLVRWAAPTDMSPFHRGRGPVAIVASLYAPDSRDISQNDQWVRTIVGAMEHEFAEQGRHTIFVNRVPRLATSPLPLSESLKQALADQTLSGLAFIAFDLQAKQIEEAYEAVAHSRLPVVSVVAEPLSLPVPHVLYDNHRAGFQAAQHLLERDYSRITVLVPERAHWSEARVNGIRAAVSRAGLPRENVTVLRGDDIAWDYDTDPMVAANTAIEQAFANGWAPDGPVICASDMVALVLMEVLAERGLSSDIPVLGFDDHDLSRDAGLTTMRPPTQSMGIEAARLLMAGPESGSNGTQLRLCSRLIPRRSTALRPVAQPVTAAVAVRKFVRETAAA